jgi:hypothetical protein
MSIFRSILWNIRMLLLAMSSICVLTHVALGEYRDPTTRVNVNEQTDLFEKSTDDYSGLQRQIDGQKDSAMESVRSGGGMGYLVKGSREEIEQNAAELASIKATELNSRGTEEMAKQNVINELYVDYSQPLNKQHLKDAKRIAKGQDELMGNLLERLKDIGVDCKTVKGLLEQEPTYYLQLETITQKDTVYNQTFCEQLRNTYNCEDTVSLTCQRKGKGFGEWEPRAIKFSGHALHTEKMNWGYAVKWKNKRWGWHITPQHPKSLGAFGNTQVDSIWHNNPGAIIADARAYIASKLGVLLEQIGENVEFPDSGRGMGNIGGVGHRWRVVWDEYEFKYQFREAFDICEEWKEDWTERCRLQ